jgi:hypothetical protein
MISTPYCRVFLDVRRYVACWRASSRRESRRYDEAFSKDWLRENTRRRKEENLKELGF